jgi:hypothetical protein
MRVNFPKILLLIIGAARLRASLTSPEHQKLIGQSQSVFDTVRKAWVYPVVSNPFFPVQCSFPTSNIESIFQLTSLKIETREHYR